MRTVLRPDNPFAPDRAGYAWEKVPATSKAHLDFGCHQGRFLHSLKSKQPSGLQRLVGVDVARKPIEAGRTQYPDLELHHLTDPHHLPFPDADFDSASILDVIEHVADQKQVLDELYRVLAPGGVLIATVPGLYALSCFDLGNLKFRLPRIHRWIYRLQHSRTEYERRYADNPDGLVGDVAAAKGWHEHFTRHSLGRLLEASGFSLVEFDGSGYFTRAISLMTSPFLGVQRSSRWLRELYSFDMRWFASMNLFCLAAKKTCPLDA